MTPAPIFRPAASRLSALLAILAVPAAIAPGATAAQEVVVDPPGRVARLSYIEGQVSFALAESEDWVEAVLNRPLTSGDRLWLDSDARAELEVGSATLHLDRGTGFGFVALDDAVMQMSLTEGAATIRVRTLAEAEVIQVETPNATVHLRQPGEYHFEFELLSDRTVVRARSGETEVTGGSKSYIVRADEEGIFTDLDDLRAQIGPIAPRTAFETWANDRTRREETSVSSRYVSREVIGYEDLDYHGEWLHEPAYGYVWRPSYVAYDWAPYRYGRWVWISPWGWTWVDDARWGFAPFHYGRWAHLRNRWCWVPGPRHLRPVYAPALVGWTGSPPGSPSYSFGRGIGWFPLAPHEVYVPGYRYTPRHIRRINVSNTILANHSQITSTYTARDRHQGYRHRAHPDAVTVVQQDRFIAGRPIGDQRLRLNDRELRAWRDSPRPPAVAPNRESVLAGQPRRDRPIVHQGISSSQAVPQGRQEQARDYARHALPRGRVADRDPSGARPAGGLQRSQPTLIQQSQPTYSPRAARAPAAYSRPAYSAPRQPAPARQSSQGEAQQALQTQQSQSQSRQGSRPTYQQR
jgi:hypothetical protein